MDVSSGLRGHHQYSRFGYSEDMWTGPAPVGALLALAAASLLLAALGAAATAFRSALLIVGEDGLVEDSAKGDAGAARLLSAIRDPSRRHPFSLWLGGTVLKAASALCAGAAGAVLLRSPAG